MKYVNNLRQNNTIKTWETGYYTRYDVSENMKPIFNLTMYKLYIWTQKLHTTPENNNYLKTKMAATAYNDNVNVTGHERGLHFDAQGRSLEPMHIFRDRIANLCKIIQSTDNKLNVHMHNYQAQKGRKDNTF